MTPAARPADAPRLNADCHCIHLDRDEMRRVAGGGLAPPGWADLLAERCPHVHAASPVFVPADALRRMADVVRAVESVAAMPAWHEEVLARAPATARHEPRGPRGVFFGYDFHLAPEGAPGLIEINTNAGGALLNAMLSRAQRACCEPVDRWLPPASTADAFEARILAMFVREWSLAGHAAPLRRIAIVDEQPTQQYLYPEFLLFQQLFRAHGIDAVIVDPAELALRHGVLHAGDLPVDLVYNRLTDFSLDAPSSATLREAWLQRAVVLTPHPRAHALLADKRNLALLTDPGALHALGVPEATQAVLLAGIPRTEIVEPAHAARLWAGRRRLFFKPFAGYGGRAAWRGDKLTTRVWQEILAGGYVAQALVAPGARTLADDGAPRVLKFDLRDYVYDGEVQFTAARLYQGQTTNFRTPGGGFAPVRAVPEPLSAPGPSAP